VVERPDGVTVVNDAYNANPDSMRAALHALVALSGGKRRTWAVVGWMGELGDGSDAAHAEIADTARRLGVDELVAVGSTDYPGARRTGSVDEAVELLRAELAPGDVVLVKASRAAGLDRVAAGLLSTDAAPGAVSR
jgi:UDP-N-acetylmuramoyl-tripeptide--D-alanyl-D-alanine ligase